MADCGAVEFEFVDSSDKPHGLTETFSLVIALESLRRPVSMVSRERMVDVDGDSVPIGETVGEYECRSISGLFTH